MPRRLAFIGIVACFLLAACNQPTSPPPDPAPTSLQPPQQAAPEGPARPFDTAQALQWKTTAHYQEVEAALKIRNKPAAAPSPRLEADPPVAMPEIRWMEPQAVELTIGPKQSDEPPHPAPPLATVTIVVPAPLPDAAAPPARPAEDPLETALAQQLRDHPRDLVAQIDYQLLQMLRGRQVPEKDRIESLSSEDRELLAALLDAIVNLRATVRNEPDLMLARKIRPLVDLADRLRAQGALRIPTIVLCTRVDAFGVYEPMAMPRFAAGREQAVIVYCEIENFSSRLNDQRLWETNLTQEAVLYNDAGQRVWEEKRQPTRDLSRNLRRDFYLARKVRIPATLPAGRYHLKVTVSDEQSSRIAEAGAALVVGQPVRDTDSPAPLR